MSDKDKEVLIKSANLLARSVIEGFAVKRALRHFGQDWSYWKVIGAANIVGYFARVITVSAWAAHRDFTDLRALVNDKD